MSKRVYAQYCALARAFDVLGERWTPLVLRELAMGPRRYADLLEGLPGVGTSLLAQRLRELEEEGVVERVYLPPPAARQAYALTDDGRALAEALVPIARWGARRLGERRDGEAFSLSWLLLFLRAAANVKHALGVHDVYEFHLDADAPDDAATVPHDNVMVFHVTVDDGVVDARPGPAPQRPDLVVRTDAQTFVRIGTGACDPGDPDVMAGVQVVGDPEAARRCLAILVPIAAPSPVRGASQPA